mgnify:CR=1 FL=1
MRALDAPQVDRDFPFELGIDWFAKIVTKQNIFGGNCGVGLQFKHPMPVRTLGIEQRPGGLESQPQSQAVQRNMQILVQLYYDENQFRIVEDSTADAAYTNAAKQDVVSFSAGEAANAVKDLEEAMRQMPNFAHLTTEQLPEAAAVIPQTTQPPAPANFAKTGISAERRCSGAGDAHAGC